MGEEGQSLIQPVRKGKRRVGGWEVERGQDEERKGEGEKRL
jgi:hypothetical protein